MGTFLGVPVISILVHWGLYLRPPYFGKLPVTGVVLECVGIARRGRGLQREGSSTSWFPAIGPS